MDQITFFWPVINILILKNLFSCLFVDLICDFVLAQAGSFVFSLHMKSACKRMWLQPTEEGTMDIFSVFSLNFSLFLEVITWGKSALHSSRAFSTNFCQSKLLYNNSFFFFLNTASILGKSPVQDIIAEIIWMLKSDWKNSQRTQQQTPAQ